MKKRILSALLVLAMAITVTLGSPLEAKATATGNVIADSAIEDSVITDSVIEEEEDDDDVVVEDGVIEDNAVTDNLVKNLLEDSVTEDSVVRTVISNAAGTMNEVYVKKLTMHNAAGTESEPTTWETAVTKVAPGGTIYIMETGSGIDDTVKITGDMEYDLNATICYKGKTTAPTSLIEIESGANVVFKGTTFDGAGLGSFNDWSHNTTNILDVSGTLTLGEDTVVQNYRNTRYGAAINVWSAGGTLNLKGARIINNSAGVKKTPQYGGGITVGGTLNVYDGTTITGNTITDDNSPLDVLFNSRAIVNLEGDIDIGTIAFSGTKTNSDRINILSPLQNDIDLRMHKFFEKWDFVESEYIFILTPDFALNSIIAGGSNGYELTAEDKAKIKIPDVAPTANTQFRTAMNSDKQVYVTKLYTIGKYSGLLNGTANGDVEISPADKVVPETEIIFTSKPKQGYKYRAGSIFVDNYAETNVYVPVQVEDTNTFKLNMPKEDIYVNAAFDPIPKATKPAISIDYHKETLKGFESGGIYTINGMEFTANTAGEITAVPYMSKSLTIVRKGHGTDLLDSDKQILPVPTRPVAPTATTVKASANTAKDGKIHITAGTTLEYRSATGQYAPVVGNQIGGLGVDTYYLRQQVTDTSFAGEHAQVHVLSQNSAVFEVEGEVNDGTSPVQNATVKLYNGTKLLGTKTTNNLGIFEFAEVPNGLYQLVVTYNTVTMTVEARVSGADVNVGKLVIPTSSKNSIVVLTEESPAIVVNELPQVFDHPVTDANKGVTQAELDDLADANHDNITIKLTSDQKTDITAENAEDIKTEAQADSKTIGSYVDFSMFKEITAATGGTGTATITKLEEVPNLIKITIPLDKAQQGHKDYVIYRYHNGAVQGIKEGVANADAIYGEYFDINPESTVITLYVRRFSTYAIGYVEIIPAPPETGGSSGSSGKENTYSKTEEVEGVTGVADWLVTDKHVKYMNGDQIGNFKPTANMTRAEVAQMFYNLLIDKNVGKKMEFQDVSEKAWYAEAVGALASIDVLEGFAGKFRPNEGITRGEFTAVAMRFAKMAQADCQFSDVSKKLWSYEYIAAATNYGWINGYEDNTFLPNKKIVRAEVVTIVNRMLERTPDKLYIDAHKQALKIFPDASKPSYWAWYHIVEATNAHAHTFDLKEERWTSLELLVLTFL